MNTRRFECMAAAAGLLTLISGGCTAIGSLFDPEFLSALGGGTQVATLPGDAPSVAFWFDNRTNRSVVFTFALRDANENVVSNTYVVTAFERSGEAFACPVSEATIGDLSNTTVSGAAVLFEPGNFNAFIQVEPFGVVLREGVNYNCGDSVTFVVQASSRTSSGYESVAEVRRAQ